MPKDLYSAAHLADLLGVARNTVHLALTAGRIEVPAYHVHGPGGKPPTAAWTAAQVERIKRKWEPGKPGRPRGHSPQGA